MSRPTRAASLALAVAMGVGCAATESANVPGAVVEPAAGQEDSMTGFSWVIDQELAGMPRPGRTGDLEADFSFLERSGIELLVSLTETPPSPEVAADHGIELVHLPVRDFTAPTIAQLRSFLRRAPHVIARGGAVGVHCGAGKGRTGTFLAAYLIGQGTTPARAMARIRELRPGSIETPEQERVLVEFADALNRFEGPAVEGASDD